jgi:hypothetical protein
MRHKHKRPELALLRIRLGEGIAFDPFREKRLRQILGRLLVLAGKLKKLENRFPVPPRQKFQRRPLRRRTPAPDVHKQPPIGCKVSTLLAARIGVCVPFAPLASFALNGSMDFDSFALGFPIHSRHSRHS